MASLFELDGSAFPKDPLTKRWARQPTSTGGTGGAIYAQFWRLELNFGTLAVADEVSFFETRWLEGGLHTAVLPHPKTGNMTSFTGVNIQDFTYETNDVESNSWADNPVLILGHISLSATGTV